MSNALQTFEYLVRRALTAPGAPPIVGLIELENQARARDELSAYLAGEPRRLETAFRKYPYAACWVVATEVRRSYGVEENHAVYPPLEAALRIALPGGGSGRGFLKAGFETLCRKLGVATGEYDRNVDLYLAQAGVPEGMLGHLAAAFLRQERSFGPPPVESSLALTLWEGEALALLPHGVRTPRLPLEIDETGWHAALYAEIRRNPDQPPTGRFEAAFRKALKTQGERIAARGGAGEAPPLPRLRWDEDGVKLEIPRLEGRMKLWPEREGVMLRLRGGDLWPLPEPWPMAMRWEGGGHHGESIFLSDPKAVALFDRQTGRLLREILADGRRESLDALELVALSRRPFSVDGAPARALGEGGYAAFLDLSGGGTRRMAAAEGALELALRPRRRITVSGGELAKGPQGALYGSEAVFRLETGRSEPEERLLKLSAPGRKAEMRLKFGAGGVLNLPLERILDQLDLAAMEAGEEEPLSDPFRLNLELCGPTESGSAGAVFAAFRIWPEAEIRDEGFAFEAPEPPRNLVEAHSRHILRDGRGQIRLELQGGYAAARLAFEIAGEIAVYDVPYPGVVCIRRSADGRERFLPLGSQIALREEERFDSLVIRCPDPQADLILCGKLEKKPFLEGRPRVAALRDLMGARREDRIFIRKPSGAEIHLVQAVQAFAPKIFAAVEREGGLLLRLETAERIDALRLNLEDESGARFFAEIALGHRPVETRPPVWLSGEVDPQNPARSLLRADLEAFPPGLHLAQAMARPIGQDSWKRLGNPRGDVYGFLLDGGPSPEPPGAEVDFARRFATLSRWMALCFAEESWSQIGRILPGRWRALGLRLDGTPQGLSAILAAAAAPPGEEAAPSWVPLAHPLSFLPELYAAPPESFAALAAGEDPEVSALALVGELASGRLREKSDLASAALLAFANLQKADLSGETLRGFDPKRFLGLLPHPHIDSDPTAGWFWRGSPWLGAAHWRAAHLRFAERLEAAGVFGDQDLQDLPPNGRRQTELQKLMSFCWRHAAIKPPAPRRDLGHEEPSLTDLQAAATLCDFACAARDGLAEDWARRLSSGLGRKLPEVWGDLAFLLRLAPELFAFYLGLWQLKAR